MHLHFWGGLRCQGGVVPCVLVCKNWGGVQWGRLQDWEVLLMVALPRCRGSYYTFPAAPEVTILEPLQDVQLREGQDAHFRCRLSRASGQEARWALGGVPLQANEMNDITVEHGTMHSLILHKVGPWDLSLSIRSQECGWEGKVPTPVALDWGLHSRNSWSGLPG